MKCPNCGHEDETLGAIECGRCGVIFSKWQAKRDKAIAAAVTPPQAPASAPESPDVVRAALKYALWAGLAALFVYGGRVFNDNFGAWFKAAQRNAPAAKQAAMQDMAVKIPKVNVSQLSPDAGLAREISAARQAQVQGSINGSMNAARQNAASAAAAGSSAQPR